MIVIYDMSGYIYLSGSGFPTPQGIPFLELEIPSGKRLVSVDVTREPHKPVFEDIPKSDFEILSEAVRELSEKVTEGTKENPIVWVNGMTAYKGKFYSCDGKLWECIEDSGIGLWGTPQYLARYFKEVTLNT